MNELVFSYNPLLLLTAIILTFISSYTAIDLFTLIDSSERNKRFLFFGGSFSLGIGIWVMNFIGVLALSHFDSIIYNIPIIILSVLFGILLTCFAFYFVINRQVNLLHLIIGSCFMTAAVFFIYFIGMYGMNVHIVFHSLLLVVGGILIFCSSFFVLWMLFHSKSFLNSHQAWLKPISAIISAGSIIESHFLLIKSSTFYKKDNFLNSSQTTEIMYFVLMLLMIIISGIVISSTIKSKRWAVSDMYLKDIQFALDEAAIVIITNPKGVIIYANEKFEEISKYKREEILGQTHRLVNSGYHNKEFFREMWDKISAGKVWKGEIRNRAKDGSFYWVNTTIVPLLNAKGKPYQYVSIRTDITKKKENEESLKNTLKEISDIKFALDQASIVAFTDALGVITNVNAKFCEISGYTREELIGKNHNILNSGFHTKAYFKELWKTIGEGYVWRGEIRNRAKDGHNYWVDTTIVPFLDDAGRPYQYLAIRSDITEKKKTEEILHRQDKLAAVGQLAAGVAHEIRNPLTSMKGYAEFLLDTEVDDQRKEFIDIILDEIDRVNQIVEDFMVLAKPKTAQLEEKNIIPIIQNVLSLLEFEARKKKVEVFFEADHEIIMIECDEDRLKQVFLNFIKNGIEAMPNGGQLTVKVNIHENQVQILIQDTGVGIPQEKLKNIGEPFFTTKENGNGLGLMVSFKIIESHHGKVFIESEQDKGTTFSIILPTKTA
ncbi:PAS domain S-box protein [Cytobacillus sp. Hz8]|uniref:PAS domain S-box protein n=1 Tax=Cytobacillus sp. Hz8 TaxID=3347168 RepID=UPI0035D8FE06